jgi:hypothetical protein
MIKIRERAEVESEFKELLWQMARIKLADIRQRLAGHTGVYLERQKKTYQIAIGNARGLLDDRLMDAEITRLRSLPYIKFAARTYKDGDYLIGVTRDVIMDASPRQRWDVGQYAISVPVEDFIRGSLSHIHCIPLREPKADVRTPHHHAMGISTDNRIDISLVPSTCWGSMSGIVMGAMNNFMVAEFFRSMHIYVTRYNTSSPLASIHRMAFARAL